MAKQLEIRNSTAEFLTFLIDGKETGVQVMYKDESIWATQKAMAELFDDICRQTVRLFPNVAETLQSLSNGGVTIAIASSRGKESLTDMLSWLSITPYITHVLGEQDVANKKPAPDMALHILSLTHTEAEEALVVGDTRYDILMGQNAGCRTCGVSYGNHTAEALQQQGADYIIDDFAQLLQILRINI